MTKTAEAESSPTGSAMFDVSPTDSMFYENIIVSPSSRLEKLKKNEGLSSEIAKHLLLQNTSRKIVSNMYSMGAWK